MVSSNNVEIIMTEMTDIAGCARRYTCFITVKTMNFCVPPGILKFQVYVFSGICTFGFMLPYHIHAIHTEPRKSIRLYHWRFFFVGD